MNGMRVALSQQQGAISKLVAKRARAEERAAMAEERCKKADAAVEQQSKHVLELETQLQDAAISIQLQQAISERVGSESCAAQAAHQQRLNHVKESLKLELQQVEAAAALAQERLCGELDSLRSAHALQVQQLQATHELEIKALRAEIEQTQQCSLQLADDLNHAQADAMDLLQKCDVLRQSMTEDAAACRSKLSLAAAAASQSHSEMVAAQEARATSEAAVTAMDTQNKHLLSQIHELSCTLASLRLELDQQQQSTADMAASARAAGIAQQIAESELQLEKESTLLHRSRAESAEKQLEESTRMRADVQVVFAAASDELADALAALRGDDDDAAAAYLACSALLQMLRHTRPVLVDPDRHDAAINALQCICAVSASQAGRKVAAMAVAVADAMREADEWRSRCCDKEQQLQLYLAQAAEATAFGEQLQQMHVRIDALTEALEEERRRHQVLLEQNSILSSKAAAEAVCALQQRQEDAVALERLQCVLQDLHDSSACAAAASSHEVSRLTAAVAAISEIGQKHEAEAAAAQMQVSILETACADLQSKLDRCLQDAQSSSAAADASAAIASNLQSELNSLFANSKSLAVDIEQRQLAVQAAELRLDDAEKTARLQREEARQQLECAQHAAATEVAGLNAALADANSRIAALSTRISDLQRHASEEQIKVKEERESAAAAAAQLEADHAQLLRDCELLHAYQSETLQELQQLQALYDQLLAERDEIEAASAAHAEEQDKRLHEISEVAAAAESERAQLLRHLHLSQEENLQLHRQQQRDEREKNSLQSAVSLQNDNMQREAAARVQELQVPLPPRPPAPPTPPPPPPPVLAHLAPHVMRRQRLRRCRPQMLIYRS